MTLGARRWPIKSLWWQVSSNVRELFWPLMHCRIVLGWQCPPRRGQLSTELGGIGGTRTRVDRRRSPTRSLAPEIRCGRANSLRPAIREGCLRTASRCPNWLVVAGFVHQAMHEQNTKRVRRMSWLSGALAALMVVQTLAWLATLVVN
jgi:hypothetical protein